MKINLLKEVYIKNSKEVFKLIEVLTVADLQERWQLSEGKIRALIVSKTIVPIEALRPSIRFNKDYIEQIESGIKERTTLKERKLERENTRLKEEVAELRNIIIQIQSNCLKIYKQEA